MVPPVGVSTDSGWNCTPSTRIRTMPHAHDLAVVGTGGDHEVVGNRHRCERVVAADLDLIGESGEDTLAVVVYDARLPVEQRTSLTHRAAEGLHDRLVAQTDAERRHLGTERADELEREPGVLGPPGPGETTSRSGRSAAASSTVMASLRWTCTSAPRSSKRWTRFHVNES